MHQHDLNRAVYSSLDPGKVSRALQAWISFQWNVLEGWVPDDARRMCAGNDLLQRTSTGSSAAGAEGLAPELFPCRPLRAVCSSQP